MYPAGRDGAACSKRIVGYAIAGKHANRPASKTLCKIGGSELPAHQGCDNFSCRVRGSQHTSADYTATMNKYGFLASVGRTGVCYDNAAADIIQRHPRRKKTRQPAGYTTPEEKQSKRWHHGLNTDCDQTRLQFGDQVPHPERSPSRMEESQDSSLNHNPSFSLPSTKPIAVQVSGVGGVD